MNGPHVVALYYKFVVEQLGDDFSKASPLSGSLGEFDFNLSDDVLEVRPRVHFASIDDAKLDLDPYLRSWEQSALVGSHELKISFQYQRAHVVRPVLPPGFASETGTVVGRWRASGVDVLLHSQYPSPDPNFAVSNLTDLLTSRYHNYRLGREPLPSFGYWLLTELEQAFGEGSRKKVARELKVEFKVLDKLGQLTSRADPNIGRKAEGDRRPLTLAELAWLDAVAVRLIRRVGEYNAHVPLTEITLSDLPPL